MSAEADDERRSSATTLAAARRALDEDYAHLGAPARAARRRHRGADGARGGVPRRRAVVGRRHRRHALRALPGSRRAARRCSRSSTTAPSVQALVRVTPGISLHIPWDKPPTRPARRCERPRAPPERGLSIDSMNSNTFQDQPGQRAVLQVRQPQPHRCRGAAAGDRAQPRVPRDRPGARRQRRTPSGSATAATFPARSHLRRALDRYLESLRAIYAALPDGWRLFIEHKLYEPAFYSTVLNDWGTSYLLRARSSATAASRSSISATTRPTSTSSRSSRA